MKSNLENHKHLIKHLRSLSKDEQVKALDLILNNKLINKTTYKAILKECNNESHPD